MQEHLFRHFNYEDHRSFIENVFITLIDKTDGKDPKKRDNYWKRMLKTYAPFWFSVVESL